ncbi:unnamed protein product [Aspergillus oryzae var. brunneus]|uniref:Unnamed protein product n=1 Tax=Aspergillus oryzae var. brunneus TaxID=332754 RepID=A0ABQ6KLM3_ASPOZ|nr:unnamed protein product [Aspergillus oryzae var. brunneus]
MAVSSEGWPPAHWHSPVLIVLKARPRSPLLKGLLANCGETNKATSTAWSIATLLPITTWSLKTMPPDPLPSAYVMSHVAPGSNLRKG